MCRLARVNEASHSFTCHRHVYPHTKWDIVYLFPSRRASPHLDRYSFSRPAWVRSWVCPGGWLHDDIGATAEGLQHGSKNNTWSALRELHWLPITARIKYKLCLLAHKLTVGQASKYIADLLMPVAETSFRSALRASAHGDFAVRRPRLKIGERGISCRQSWKRVNRQHCSSASLKHFCSPHHTACLKITFKLCYAPSVNL